jgi:hypothetical protein
MPKQAARRGGHEASGDAPVLAILPGALIQSYHSPKVLGWPGHMENVG